MDEAKTSLDLIMYGLIGASALAIGMYGIRGILRRAKEKRKLEALANQINMQPNKELTAKQKGVLESLYKPCYNGDKIDIEKFLKFEEMVEAMKRNGHGCEDFKVYEKHAKDGREEYDSLRKR